MVVTGAYLVMNPAAVWDCGIRDNPADQTAISMLLLYETP